MLDNPQPEAKAGGFAGAQGGPAEPPARLIRRLAIPAIIGLSANALYHTVNLFFLGWLGTEAISAVSSVLPLLVLGGAIGEGLAVGTASYAAVMLGAGRSEEAHRTATTGFALAIAIGLGVTALAAWHLEGVLRLVGVTEAAMPLALSFMRIILAGYTLLLLQIFCDFLAISEGNTRFSMWVLMVAFGVNIVLDPVFIFALDMGVTGAAMATVVAQLTAVTIYTGYFVRGIGRLRIRLRHLRPSAAILAKIASLGVPATLATALTALAFGLVYATAASYGDAEVAAIGIVLRLFTLGALPVFGFCLGARSVLGFAWGAGDSARVLEAARFMLRVAFGFCALYALLMLTLAPSVIGVFSADPAVVATGTRACHAVFACFAFFGPYVVLLTLLQATGKAMLAGIVLLAPQGYFLIPGLLILPKLWGFDGLLASQLVAAGLTAILSAGMLSLQLGALAVRQPRAPARCRSGGGAASAGNDYGRHAP
jgi:putative MATE family efflux protein